jgi:hypothetical protein
MTEQPEQPDQFAVLLAAIESARAESEHRFDRLEAALGQVTAAAGQLRADVAAVKVDTGFLEGAARNHYTAITRHTADPDAHRRAA